MAGQHHVHETSLRVRFAETDMMGIVHHANYLIYFEAGRVDYSHQAGAPYADLENNGFSLAVSEVQIRYLNPARFDQWLVVRTWVEEILSRAVTFSYEIVDRDSQAMIVTGTTRLICVDRSGQVRRIPETWASAIRPLAASS